MRIIAGKFKGITLSQTTGNNTRPLKDMVKESIFNFLNHSNKISLQIKKAKVLDLYSGTGSFGLECISREAQEVFFIEKDENAIKVLALNIPAKSKNSPTKLLVPGKLKFPMVKIRKKTEKSGITCTRPP